MRFGFGRAHRLRRHSEFAKAQRGGRRVGTPHFTLLVAAQDLPRTGIANLPSPERPLPSGVPRLGVVVGRKVGGAVSRNRVKRLCRECFRLWPDLLPDGIDLVVIARPGADALGLAQVRAEWRSVELQIKKRAAEALARSGRPDHPPAPGNGTRNGAGNGSP
ncbi:MAG: ribonuclease P protein component [Myxococcota bacterium]|nr:ribonuclease P protein component [Myxococcota bacterium]